LNESGRKPHRKGKMLLITAFFMTRRPLPIWWGFLVFVRDCLKNIIFGGMLLLIGGYIQVMQHL